jgi:hypothetical protein
VALLVIAGAIVGGIAASRLGSHETAATRALEARLPADVYGNCSATDRGAGVRAALTCSGKDPRVQRIEVVQVADAPTLATRFRTLSADRQLINRRCADETGNSGGFWTSNGVRQGSFACFVDRSGQRRLLWQYGGQAVEVQAVGKDGSAASARDLYAWWSTQVRNRPLAG